jgi:hypothetical protein
MQATSSTEPSILLVFEVVSTRRIPIQVATTPTKTSSDVEFNARFGLAWPCLSCLTLTLTSTALSTLWNIDSFLGPVFEALSHDAKQDWTVPCGSVCFLYLTGLARVDGKEAELLHGHMKLP